MTKGSEHAMPLLQIDPTDIDFHTRLGCPLLTGCAMVSLSNVCLTVLCTPTTVCSIVYMHTEGAVQNLALFELVFPCHEGYTPKHTLENASFFLF